MLGEGYSDYFIFSFRNYFFNEFNGAKVIHKNQENSNLLPGWFLWERQYAGHI